MAGDLARISLPRKPAYCLSLSTVDTSVVAFKAAARIAQRKANGTQLHRARTMTYKTLMVHLELGRPNAGLLSIVGDLAAKFQASVIGIAACQPLQLAYGDGYVSGDVVEQDQVEIRKEVADAEREYRSALQAHAGNLIWRSNVTMEPLSDYIAREARSADLVVTGVDIGASLFDTSKHMNVSDLVMRVGRPVLIVPADTDELKLEGVVV